MPFSHDYEPHFLETLAGALNRFGQPGTKISTILSSSAPSASPATRPTMPPTQRPTPPRTAHFSCPRVTTRCPCSATPRPVTGSARSQVGRFDFIHFDSAQFSCLLYLCSHFAGHKGAVWSCRLDPAALLAGTASGDFSARVWDAITGAPLYDFPHGKYKNMLLFEHFFCVWKRII